MKQLSFRRVAAIGILLSSASIFGQEDSIEEIVVTAHPLSGEGLSQATEVLQGTELQRKLAPNIGATLAKLPGIHSAPFGSAVGRPIIHGLGGARVKIMEDRIDTLDVSVTSGDHAVAVEPFIAERIEVLKGSSTLLYGTGAIGGVVDVHTARIPHVIPKRKFSGGIQSRFNSNADGNTTALKLNGGEGVFAWHIDAAHKQAGDYKIPGFVESKRFRDMEQEDDPESSDEIELKGTLPGSKFDSDAAALGASYIKDWGFAGLAVSKIKAKYGLPGGHSHGDSEGLPSLKLEQTRSDFELGVKNPFGAFTGLNVRAAYNDYTHQEIEADGEVATNFVNKAWEARLELVYELDIWNGALGLQHTGKKFSALGEEAFIPPVNSNNTGIFLLAERSFSTFELEAGVRLEQVSHKPSLGSNRNFTNYAASLGLIYNFSDDLQLGLLADYATRAPVAEELYSDGPHLVTNTFELGNPQLKNERAINLSATLQYDAAAWSARSTIYYIHFEDFIYQKATIEQRDDFPVFEYTQDNARYFGIDAELSTAISSTSYLNTDLDISIRAMFDYVHAKLDVSGNDHIPRISPMRYGLGIEAIWGRVTANIDYLRVNKQDRVAPLELISNAYTDISADIEIHWDLPKERTLSLMLIGKNLSNAEQRIHTSFIKEFAPAPGRALEIGLQLVF